MAISYPTWPFRPAIYDGIPVQVWEGLVTPFSDDRAEVLSIIADLDAARDIAIERGGALRHPKSCEAKHTLKDDLEGLMIQPLTYYMVVYQLEPPAHPRVKVVLPEISPLSFQGHPHLYFNGEICTLFPPDGGWDGHRSSLADFLPHASVWLAKHQVWVAMRASSRHPRFIGRDDAPHGAYADILAPDAQCWCGSGQRYGRCHRPIERGEIGQSSRRRKTGVVGRR